MIEGALGNGGTYAMVVIIAIILVIIAVIVVTMVMIEADLAQEKQLSVLYCWFWQLSSFLLL